MTYQEARIRIAENWNDNRTESLVEERGSAVQIIDMRSEFAWSVKNPQGKIMAEGVGQTRTIAVNPAAAAFVAVANLDWQNG